MDGLLVMSCACATNASFDTYHFFVSSIQTKSSPSLCQLEASKEPPHDFQGCCGRSRNESRIAARRPESAAWSTPRHHHGPATGHPSDTATFPLNSEITLGSLVSAPPQRDCAAYLNPARDQIAPPVIGRGTFHVIVDQF